MWCAGHEDPASTSHPPGEEDELQSKQLAELAVTVVTQAQSLVPNQAIPGPPATRASTRKNTSSAAAARKAPASALLPNESVDDAYRRLLAPQQVTTPHLLNM